MTHGVDLEEKERLRAWLRYLRESYAHKYRSERAFAAYLGISQGFLNQTLNGEREVGLDLLYRLHNAFHQSIDVMLATDPPKSKTPADPRQASSA